MYVTVYVLDGVKTQHEVIIVFVCSVVFMLIPGERSLTCPMTLEIPLMRRGMFSILSLLSIESWNRKCVPSCGDNTGDQNDKRTAVTMLGTEEFWEFLRKKFDDDFNGE